MKIEQNIPLAPLTTLKIGGPARFFARAGTENEVVQALDYAEEKALPIFILGGGSNILVSDAGFDGLVLQTALRGIKSNDGTPPDRPRTSRPGTTAILTAAAGEDWDRFVAYCVENDLAGVECLSGIPGFIGGTPVQNVGAYGQEVSETIASVRCFDRMEKQIVVLANGDCGFSYRTSIFNSTDRERYIVLSVTFALTRGGPPKIAYGELEERFTDRIPSLHEVRDAVLSIRRSKSMVIAESDPNRRSAGSFFKNPIVENARVEEIRVAAAAERIPAFPARDGFVKIPAAWLIEQAGFYKGFRLGNAGISTKHTLAIVNLRNASAREVIDLKSLIQRAVEDKFGVRLLPEPVFVGFSRGTTLCDAKIPRFTRPNGV